MNVELFPGSQYSMMSSSMQGSSPGLSSQAAVWPRGLKANALTPLLHPHTILFFTFTEVLSKPHEIASA